MNLSVGIVGLPNVGKSTLFNALLKEQAALAANYPFATIEPNVGIVPVPDYRLQELAVITRENEKMAENPPIVQATVKFTDIAGLVKGASEGAGLGNKFLSHIREVSLIAHVVRAFEDPDVIREGSVSPQDDYITIQTELILSDLQTLQKTLENRKIEPARKALVEKLVAHLNEGKRAYDVSLTDEEQLFVKELSLLTNKPEIIVLNVSEEDYTDEKIPGIVEKYQEILRVAQDKGEEIASSQTPRNDRDNMVVVSSKIESELAGLGDEEQKEYLQELGVSISGLERLIRKAYETLGLISFLTCGEKEVKAWTITKGETAPLAAGAIHTDFTKKFIKAEVVSYSDFTENNGWKGSREKGKARLEGKEYIMQDGDVVEFKIGA